MRRLFLLFGITGSSLVIALAAGCTSSGESTPPPGDGDAAPDRRTPTPPSPEGGDAPDAPATCPPSTPITSADIEKQLGAWKAPGPPQNACAQGDLDAMQSVFDKGNGSATYEDIKKALSASCKACLFRPATNASWGPFVEVEKGILSNTSGACFATVKDSACGKARFDVEICLGASCNETACGSEAAVSQCEPVALKGACKGLVDAYVSACPDEKALVEACGTIFKTVAQTCGGGADGGLDAGK